MSWNKYNYVYQYGYVSTSEIYLIRLSCLCLPSYFLNFSPVFVFKYGSNRVHNRMLCKVTLVAFSLAIYLIRLDQLCLPPPPSLPPRHRGHLQHSSSTFPLWDHFWPGSKLFGLSTHISTLNFWQKSFHGVSWPDKRIGCKPVMWHTGIANCQI